jgi:preprotein translocase subunit YajC
LADIAYAVGPSGAPQGGGAAFAGLVPLIIIFAIFYFLLIRPQQKQMKAHKEMLGALKVGDNVVTSGGLHGKITGLTEKIVTLEIAKDVKVKVERGSISEVRKD